MPEYNRHLGIVGGIGGIIWLFGIIAITPLAGENLYLSISQVLINNAPGLVATAFIMTLRSAAQPMVVFLTGCGLVVVTAVLGGYSHVIPEPLRRPWSAVSSILILTTLGYIGSGLQTPMKILLATGLGTTPLIIYVAVITRNNSVDTSTRQVRRAFMRRLLAGAGSALLVNVLARAIQNTENSLEPDQIDQSPSDEPDRGKKQEQGTAVPSTPTPTSSVSLDSKTVKHGVTVSNASVTSAFSFDFAGMPAPVTPLENHYIVDKAVDNPEIKTSDWSLSIRGAVVEPYELPLSSLLDHDATKTETVTMVCISNDVGGELISTGRWVGVPLRALIRQAGPTGGIQDVVTQAADGYHEGIPWAYVREHPEVMIAIGVNGRQLTTNHGFPARLLIPGRYGMRSTKWVNNIKVSKHEHDSYWEERGWDEEAVVNTLSAIRAVQQRGDRIGIGGIAFSGLRDIQAVEVSVDGGNSWLEATLEIPPGPLTWRRWRLITDRPAGTFEVVVRAIDETGTIQTQEWQKKYKGGATGWHRTTVDP